MALLRSLSREPKIVLWLKL